MIEKTPKGLRLHLGIFGRTNVGKSSFLNLVAGQDVSITSPMPGTTTDVVEKTMELLPIGPVVFLDTAGLDDQSEIGSLRTEKSKKVFERSDVLLLILEANLWTKYEEDVIREAHKRGVPILAVINKMDQKKPDADFLQTLLGLKLPVIQVSSINTSSRERVLQEFKKQLLQICPEDFLNPTALIGDLVPSGGLVILIVPIDLQAPKGRLILPQVQAIRDILDNDASVLVVKEREYLAVLEKLKHPPSLVVCDSQVVQKMVADTPGGIPCTTFSILFSRFKGDLNEMVRGALAIEKLQNGDKVLIAEACTHHAAEDDIGRVKIPRWLKQYTGLNLDIQTYAGCDYPVNLQEYKLIIHCGSCMLNRRSMLSRIQNAKESEVAMTNYGVCISYLQGVLTRALSPFPSALLELENISKLNLNGCQETGQKQIFPKGTGLSNSMSPLERPRSSL